MGETVKSVSATTNTFAQRYPDFVAVGAIKAATSSLHHYLAQHPQIALPKSAKELKFFHWDCQEPVRFGAGPGDDRIYENSVKSWDEYLSEFAVTSVTKCVGEVCPSYLFDSHAIKRIAERLPNARIIVILRDPTARAYSHYLHSRRLGKEPAKSFEKALDLEQERVSDGWGINWQYAGQGFYTHQIERLWRLFSRENVRIYEFAEFTRNSQQTLRDVFSFLEVDCDFTVNTSEKHNEGNKAFRSTRIKRLLNQPHWMKDLIRGMLSDQTRDALYRKFYELNSRSAPKIDPRTRHELSIRYQADVEHLEQILGWDLSHWRH